jgi:hypothetical protein
MTNWCNCRVSKIFADNEQNKISDFSKANIFQDTVFFTAKNIIRKIFEDDCSEYSLARY